MDTTSCPQCGTATDAGRCPRCARLRADLDRLIAELATLDQRDLRLRQEYAALTRRRHQVQQRIAALQAELARPAPSPAPPASPEPAYAPPQADSTRTPVAASPPPAMASAAPGTPRVETSSRSVQTVLLALGGLLLAVAAIVFTAVAWTTFGLAARTAILAGFTVLGLALPVVLRRRGLVATAETVASLALLLVLLDGYAAWTVDLLGVRRLPGAGYAAAIFAATAVLSCGYGWLSRLTAPWYAALFALQPVASLAAAAADASVLGHAWGVTLTAALSLAAYPVLARTVPNSATVRAMALGLFLLAASLASLLGGIATFMAESAPEAIGAGGVFLAIAAQSVAAAARSTLPAARHIAAGVTAVALVIAITRPATRWLTADDFLIVTITVAMVWAVARLAPEAWRTGGLVACWGTAAVVAIPATVNALADAARVGDSVDPVWRVDTAAWHVSHDATWGQCLALVLLAAGSMGLLPDRLRRTLGRHTAAVSLALLALAVPPAFSLPWWAPSTIAVVAGLGLVAVAAHTRPSDGGTRDHGRRAILPGVAGAFLLLYAAATSLMRPGLTALILTGIAIGAASIAASVANLTHQQRSHAGHVVGGLAVATAIGLFAAIAGAAGAMADWQTIKVLLAMVAAAFFGLVASRWVRRSAPEWLPYAVTGVGLSTGTVTATTLAVGGQHTGFFAAATGFIGVLAGTLLLPSRRAAAIGQVVAAAFPLSVATLTALPGLLSPLQTYLWLFGPWQGTGTTTRAMLSPEPLWFPNKSDHLVLMMLAVACGTAVYGFGKVVEGVLVKFVGVFTALVLVAPIALNWAWPALPVMALGFAIAAGLLAALHPRAATPHPATAPGAAVASQATAASATTMEPRPETATRSRTWRSSWLAPNSLWFAVPVWVIVGSIGLAACLATLPATVAGLAAVTAAAGVAARRGRTAPARVIGWAIAGVAAGSFADTTGRLMHLGPEPRAYGVLLVAVALLGVSALLRPARRAAESRATEWVSYAVVGLAILIAVSSARAVAIVLASYGVMLGLSAVRPGRWHLRYGAVGCELVAWWVFLAGQDVGVVEAYTVPFAAAALIGGLWTLRRSPHLSSWQAYGVALVGGFLPSVAALLAGDDPPARRLGVGLAAMAVLILGARRQRRAPVIVGAVVLGVVALRELVGLWDVIPQWRWALLAAGGLVLVGLGATYERRRRDLERVRQALARMR